MSPEVFASGVAVLVGSPEIQAHAEARMRERIRKRDEMERLSRKPMAAYVERAKARGLWA